jgi:hypothetical protein
MLALNLLPSASVTSWVPLLLRARHGQSHPIRQHFAIRASSRSSSRGVGAKRVVNVPYVRMRTGIREHLLVLGCEDHQLCRERACTWVRHPEFFRQTDGGTCCRGNRAANAAGYMTKGRSREIGYGLASAGGSRAGIDFSTSDKTAWR